MVLNVTGVRYKSNHFKNIIEVDNGVFINQYGEMYSREYLDNVCSRVSNKGLFLYSGNVYSGRDGVFVDTEITLRDVNGAIDIYGTETGLFVDKYDSDGDRVLSVENKLVNIDDDNDIYKVDGNDIRYTDITEYKGLIKKDVYYGILVVSALCIDYRNQFGYNAMYDSIYRH